MSSQLLTNYLIVGGLLLLLGMVGFATRRNLIVMFISAELMLQGVALNLVAFNQYHRATGATANLDGQIFTLFIIAVAAAEAAIAMALVVVLFRRSATLDVSVWQSLREPGLPAVQDQSPPAEPITPSPRWPTLSTAGRLPGTATAAENGQQPVKAGPPTNGKEAPNA